VRALDRGDGTLPALPLPQDEEDAAVSAGTTPKPPPDAKDMRRYHVVAEQRPVVYRERDLIDPHGVVYRLHAYADVGDEDLTPVPSPASTGSYDLYQPI
jgi:hypothetical protein